MTNPEENESRKFDVGTTICTQSPVNSANLVTSGERLLDSNGFKISNVWYHGTSTLLLSSILERGLESSGDQQLNNYMKSLMGTFYVSGMEPVYLTPSKEVAHYWAKQTVSAKEKLFGNGGETAILVVNLPDEPNELVVPGLGGCRKVLSDQCEYLRLVNSLYANSNITFSKLSELDDLDLIKSLGLACISNDISKTYINPLSVIL